MYNRAEDSIKNHALIVILENNKIQVLFKVLE